MQWILMSTLHYPLFVSAAIYFITRQLKSGQATATIAAGLLGAYTVYCIQNGSSKYPFELAYPAHPLIIKKRKQTIERGGYYDPEIIKFELEYLNKKVFKDGYKRQFEDKKQNKYEISVKDSELYIDCIDKFEDIFEFRQEVLEENKLTDVLAPSQFSTHQRIVDNMLEVYFDFGEEYLREEYKPDTLHMK